MQPRELTFWINKLVLEGLERFSIEDFSSLKENFLDQNLHTVGGEIISVTSVTKATLENRYITFYFQMGEKYPYPSKVIDTATGSQEDNPRPATNIEPDKELFVVVDSESQRVYISNIRQKTIFISWIKDKLRKNILIKPLIEEGDFIEKINIINEVFLTTDEQFEKTEGSLAQALAQDKYGWGAKRAELKMSYKKQLVTDQIRDKIRELLGRKKEYKNVTIIGKTRDGLEAMFNMEGIVNKVLINPAVEKVTRNFVPTEVFKGLISKIEGYT